MNGKVDDKKKSGQALIEMVITLFAFFTITFMVVQIGFGFGVINYYHYVTFLSSRTYYAARGTTPEQRDAAVSVAQRLLFSNGNETFKSIAKGEGTSNTDITGLFVGSSSRAVFPGPNSRDVAWEQGVRYKFKMKLNTMPVFKSADPSLRSGLVLESESWLGKEPSTEECKNFLDQVVKAKIQAQGAILIDNGC